MKLLSWKRAVPAPAPQTVTLEDLALPLASSLYNVAHWLARNPAEAEDLVQETYLKALRGFSAFEQGTNFKAWIFRILRNTYLTSRSGLTAMRTIALEDELNDTSENGPQLYPEAAIERQTPETNLIVLCDRATLENAMQQLTAPLLEVILLCDVEEMSYKEIAGVLDIPIGTVMSRIARARAAMRRTLSNYPTYSNRSPESRA